MYAKEFEKWYSRHRAAREQEKEFKGIPCFKPGHCIGAVWTRLLEWEGGKKLQQCSQVVSTEGFGRQTLSWLPAPTAQWAGAVKGWTLGKHREKGEVRVELVQGVDKQLEHGCEYFMSCEIWEISCLGCRKCSSLLYSVYSIKLLYLG